MEIHSSFNSIGRIGQQRSPFIFEIANNPCNGDYDPKFEKFQWHHIVPQSLRGLNIFKAGELLEGFLFDEGKNCVALPTSQDPCDKKGVDAPTTHEGRHIDAYKDGMDNLFKGWEKAVANGKMTPTQVKQEFAAFLLGMRLNLDPGLMAAEAPNLQNFTRGRALLNYNDPALDNSASRYIKEFLPSEEVARERCASAEQATKIEQAHLNAIALVETYVRRTESIRNGEVRAADIIPPLDLPTNGDSPAIARWFAQQDQMNPNYGYAMMIAGGTLIGGAALAGATGIGSAVAASEASVASAPALTVIEGGKALATRAATSNLDKIAASVAGGMSAIGVSSESKASETVIHATPATALPPLSTMNAGTDFMGERGNVNHLSWRFTGYPAGSSENSLENLYRKDIEAGRAQSAAHLVIDEKGQILRNEALCCKWENTPQIHAGNSSNGIGVYVMGDGQLLPSQRTALGTLDQHFQQQIRQAGQGMGQDTLQPSSLIEREEWQGASQAPVALQAATMRARANLAVPH